MYWDPFDELDRMHKEMDRLFKRTFWDSWEKPHKIIEHKGKKHEIMPRHAFRAPVIHLQETENNLIATFEIPGVQKSDIDLLVDDDHVELKVESKGEKQKEDKGIVSYASHKQSFYKSFHLPKEVDSSKATAEYKNGALRLEMPKKHKDKKKGKRIDVK